MIHHAFCSLALALTAHATDYTWTGTGDGSAWDQARNWSPDSGVPGTGDSAIITSATAPSTIALTGEIDLRTLRFSPGALNACRIEGETLVLGDRAGVTFEKLPGDVGNGQSATQTIASALRLSGKVSFANKNRLYLGGEKLQLAGPIGGDGTFVVDGVRHGIVQLSGDNSAYSGTFIVETGSLMISHSSALGSGKDPLRLNGGAVVMGARVSTTHDIFVAADADWDAHGPNGNHDGTVTIAEGATLTVKNGGGNTTTWRGIVTGSGDLTFAAHGTTFAGSKANTLTGTVTVGGTRGATIMARAPGVDVIAGPIEMVGNGTLRWGADEQIADTSPVTFAGELPTLDLRGHRETTGLLDIQSDARIDLGEAGGRLHFADSSAAQWEPEKVLMVLNGGEGRGLIRFGAGAAALTAKQLNRIGFVDPAGLARGTYTAKLAPDGELQPTGELVIPTDLPIDLSAEAAERRRTLYEAPGIDLLTGPATPLTKEGTVISVYGDSITWGGGYLKVIKAALTEAPATKDLGVELINHGVNGGGVLAIRDGDKGTAHFGNTRPRPFAETIADDKADVGVVFIGVNDVWWRKTEPEVFERALRDLVAQAKANKTLPVLATLAIMKEEVGKRNPKCDTFAEITRKVAGETGATLVDLRAAFMACMEEESVVVRPGGAWTSDGKLLTHDGVHTNSRGDRLIAEQVAQGIFEALRSTSR